MKKKIALFVALLLLLAGAFAAKPVHREPSPLSVISSEAERKSWCEHDGYAVVGTNSGKKNLHYWLYNSYQYHNGDISVLLSEVIPKWFQRLSYFVIFDYNIISPNNELAAAVRKLMNDYNCDVSVTLDETNSGNYDYVYVNSYDRDTGTYTTYVFAGTKVEK